MTDMLNVYDRNRQKTAVLQNAFNIVEIHELNQIYSLSFCLPAEDEKVQYCQPRHFVRFGDTGELYRIKAPKYSDTDTGVISYDCEHVITTLCDNVLFGSFNIGGIGIYTGDVISFLLSKQGVQNWRLGTCSFQRQFEYLWEQENILNALYSVPKEFATQYMWTFDTVNYPWTINLVALDPTAIPEYYLRAKSNLLSSGTDIDYANICTRIYPLGYGEGVNQLTIQNATVDVNGNAVENGGTRYNKKYIDSPAAYQSKYGIVEKVLVDRRFENANSLYSYAKQMLDAYQEPAMSRSFNVTDLYPLTGQSWDDAEVGKICKMTQDDTISYITQTKRQYDKAGDLQISLSTKATDIASSVADLADRVRIESVYAQGATQLYQHSKDANATTDKGMVMSLYFPSEMRQINKVLMRLKLGSFRSYSSTTDSREVTVNTMENRVVTVSTNSVELGGISTTYSGGGTTSSSGGTSVTVSGGGASGQNTGTKAPSITVSASGQISAPTTSQTSQPSTDVTSETIWAGDNSMFYTVPWSFAQNTSGTTVTGYQYTATPGSSAFEGHTHRIDSIPDHYHTALPPGFQTSMYKKDFSHQHKIPHYHTVSISASASGGSHSHSFNVPNHSHTITAHSHNLPSLSHNHSITLNGHTHALTLNPHSHKITAGIFESGNPTGFYVYVNGTKKTNISTVAYGQTITSNADGLLASTSFEGDITQWILDNKNQIPRDQWIDIEIRPNDLAYVVSSVFVQGFVQSRGGGNY